MFRKYALRRPYSRKIRVPSAFAYTRSSDHPAAKLIASLQGKDPLAGIVASLRAAYACDADTVNELIKQLQTPSACHEVLRLFKSTDIRKYTISALRDYYASGHELSRNQAALLRTVAEAFDPESDAVFGADKKREREPDILKFEQDPQGAKSLSVSIYFRGQFFPTSRPHDLAYRLASAFESTGGSCHLVDPDQDNIEFPKSDIALIDDPHVFRKSPNEKRRFLENVREHSRVMVMFEMDPWARGLTERISANRELYDRIWAMMPSLRDADGKIDGLPASCILFPVGAPDVFSRLALPADRVDGGDIGFCGGIEEFNFLRYFWVVGALGLKHPPKIMITNHYPDQKDAASSLLEYVSKLSSTYACLNFVRRADKRVSMVGRTSDALRLRQLLVQERSAEVGYYLRAGEHFLDFADLSELEDICEALSARDAKYEDIRIAGAQYFERNYSDQAIVSHMGTWL